jgi:hypothetical protein
MMRLMILLFTMPKLKYLLNESFHFRIMQTFSSQRVKIPAQYLSSQRYDDIALVELEKAVEFKDNIQPACLQSDNDIDEIERNFTIIGFGVTDVNTRKL